MYDSGQIEAKHLGTMAPSRQTLRQRLEERKKGAEEHLADVNQALEFLDKNPSFEAFHNLIAKTGY